MLTYRFAKKSDLDQIATLHEACFADSLTTALGHDLLMSLYETYLDLKLPFFVAASEENKIVALCQGTLNRLYVRGIFEQKNKSKLAKRIIVLCIKLNKKAIKEVFGKINSVFKRKKVNVNNEPIENEASITSICVLEEYRGNGIASEILSEYEKYLRDIGIKSLNLHVLKSNSRAIHFYENHGFQIWYELDDRLAYTKLL